MVKHNLLHRVWELLAKYQHILAQNVENIVSEGNSFLLGWNFPFMNYVIPEINLLIAKQSR
ncbi:hypothetical protein IA64_16160 [Xanthomonas arboricola pv. celebensis]|nr:hypothetical protein IA64_16160 [Xanthomonas arboricola pv. celebensis]